MLPPDSEIPRFVTAYPSSSKRMLKEIDIVVLTEDVTVDMTGETMKAGNVGTIVYVHGEGEAYEVEFLAPDGNTVGLATVQASQVRPVVRYEFDHARGRTKVFWRDPTFVTAYPSKT